MSLPDDFKDAYSGAEKMLEEERTCHDDCMCNICIAKQQVWEMNEVFVKLQAELATAKEENQDLCDNVDAARQDLEDQLKGTLEGKLQARLAKAELLQEFYLEGLNKSADELAAAQKKIEEYKDALATKFNAELCEALKPLRLKLAAAEEENRWIPAGEEPPREKTYDQSAFYVVTDGKEWTIGHYDFPYKQWKTCNAPYDLEMEEITYWRPITLPEGE